MTNVSMRVQISLSSFAKITNAPFSRRPVWQFAGIRQGEQIVLQGWATVSREWNSEKYEMR